VAVLLVGESAPVGGNHYYLANSLLFLAIQEAARRVYGSHVPEGEDSSPSRKGKASGLLTSPPSQSMPSATSTVDRSSGAAFLGSRG
jgi:hypothetical protein